MFALIVGTRICDVKKVYTQNDSPEGSTRHEWFWCLWLPSITVPVCLQTPGRLMNVLWCALSHPVEGTIQTTLLLLLSEMEMRPPCYLPNTTIQSIFTSYFLPAFGNRARSSAGGDGSSKWVKWLIANFCTQTRYSLKHHVSYKEVHSQKARGFVQCIIIVSHNALGLSILHRPESRFTKYLPTILRLSYHNAEVTIDV